MSMPGLMEMFVWAILFALGVMLGYYLAGKHQYHLSDLKEGVNYFQDTPPSKIFFLREEGSSMKYAFVEDKDFSERFRFFRKEGSDIDSNKAFLIRKKGDIYYLTYL